MLKNRILSLDHLHIKDIIEPRYLRHNFSSFLCSIYFSFRQLSVMSRYFWPCKLACSCFQTSNLTTRFTTRYIIHFIKKKVFITHEVSRRGQCVAILACACWLIAIFIDTNLLKTILEKKGPLSASEWDKKWHWLYNGPEGTPPYLKSSVWALQKLARFSDCFLALSYTWVYPFGCCVNFNRFLDLCYS